MKNIFREFKEFAVKGSMIDLAVGIVIGTVFNQLVNSFVKDILMPPIGAVLGGLDFSELYVNLSGREFANLAEAQAMGAATLNYGRFINALIGFLITAWAVFIMVKVFNRIRREAEKKG